MTAVCGFIYMYDNYKARDFEDRDQGLFILLRNVCRKLVRHSGFTVLVEKADTSRLTLQVSWEFIPKGLLINRSSKHGATLAFN